MGVVRNKGREELKSFLTKLIEIVEFDQRYGYASYAAKEAATEIIVHVFFNQDNHDWRVSHSSEIGDIMKRLLKNRDETSEAIYVKLMNEKYLQDKRIFQIGKRQYFLNALVGIACNDSHSTVIKEGAMCILAFLSADKVVSRAIAMNERISQCLTSYISFRGQDKGAKCCHLAIETIISISSFPPNRQILVSKSGLMRYLIRLEQSMPVVNWTNFQFKMVREDSALEARLTLK